MPQIQSREEAEQFLHTVELPDDCAAIIVREGTHNFPGIRVTVYYSPNDGQPVIEIDTEKHTGEVRAYLNDNPIYAGDPEEEPATATAPHDYNVTLACDGAGWTGSFGIALAALVDDVLSDGAPFDARITYEFGGEDHVYDGRIIERTDDATVLTVDGAIEIESIRRLEL